MASARRPLLTATAAGTLLCALWFVPSANASQDSPSTGATAAGTAVSGSADSGNPDSGITEQVTTVSSLAGQTASDPTRLADTGSFDTTPYVVSGTLFLAVGAGFVVYSVRRERLEF
ncbi:hypothetical protein E5082_01985 [Streptomyces griseoluteus]|uniref:LPXTG cell wall anchor domain-containing protein n=1 Tax=Streptomyces griseoluteus TaxID=29306 RepID=A0A4Z1DRY6_STRGP|nr:hypothetical protein [Streptomyces griseoluteus]TGN87212.1 hypothetical protein E5082_01985 [Streptomyces griseoluteus]GHF14691.1 hypothetical protein GCM10017776_35820 [Streptomyces griseoluteus]